MAYCTLCRKPFKTDEALRQHTENAPAHIIAHCDTCNKTFPHAEALAQHTRDSPAHSDAHKCPHCTRAFATAESLAQHARDAPFHTPPHPCPHCPRTFASPAALAQHARASTRCARPPLRDTPLDAFFHAYATTAAFPYDRAQPPAATFAALRRHMGWRPGSAAGADAWAAYAAALRLELGAWFGGEDELASWRGLCRAVGVVPVPETGGGCERALRGRHVNLVDLVQWAREGGMEEGRETVRVFGSVGELARYCYDERKVFPLEEVSRAGEAGDGNVVIRHLLRRFRPSAKGRKDSVVGFLED